MNRRSTSLLVAALMLAALVAVACLLPMPYVVMSPGITENTLGTFDDKPVITIQGHKTYPTTGHLDLTTVSVTSPDFHPRLPAVLAAWWAHDEIVLPRDVVYPPDQSVDQVNQENKTQMLDSQSAAIAVGLAQAGIDAIKVVVADNPAADSPAADVLRKDDEIVDVDGQPVQDSADLVTAVHDLAPGSRLRIGILRDMTPSTVSVTTEEDPDNQGQSRIGVSVKDDFDPPFDVNIELGQDIGGPSAGLMFSLAIYDKLTPGDLTAGKFIAGTGEIATDGSVGPIGGIQQKIAGAYASGASIFLVPKDNCAEAAGSNLADDVDLVEVGTIDDAVSALDAIGFGDASTLTRCGS